MKPWRQRSGLAATDDSSRPTTPTNRLRRGAYLLPSLFTIGNILLGFLALVVALKGDFKRAALLLFAAGVLDGLDGRIARVTGTDSDFGREFDSLADVITFGMTPALLTYHWGLNELGRVGWLAPLFFVVCAAARLARFNVQTVVVDRRFFVGLPAPAAAGALGSILFFAPDVELRRWVQYLLVGTLLALGALMLSTFRYYSFKELDPKRRWSYRIALPMVAIVALIAYDPAAFFLAVSGTYTVSGPLNTLASRLRRADSTPGTASEGKGTT